jgi:hypothetical protein
LDDPLQIWSFSGLCYRYATPGDTPAEVVCNGGLNGTTKGGVCPWPVVTQEVKTARKAEIGRGIRSQATELISCASPIQPRFQQLGHH